MKIRSKNAQVAIFIIIAVLLVVVILIIFFLWRGPDIVMQPSVDPESYIEKCVAESTKEAISILSERGGDIKPDGSVMYKGTNITYLCYNANYYKPCINQRPMLIEHIEKEIADYISSNISACFSSLRQQLEDRNYVVSMAGMNVETELQSKRVIVTVKRKFVLTKNQETKNFEEFETKILTPLYELSEIAMEITNQEAQYCNFENLGFMIIYPEYDIRKDRSEDSLIYTLKDLETEQEFKFAIRTCVMPAGL